MYFTSFHLIPVAYTFIISLPITRIWSRSHPLVWSFVMPVNAGERLWMYAASRSSYECLDSAWSAVVKTWNSCLHSGAASSATKSVIDDGSHSNDADSMEGLNLLCFCCRGKIVTTYSHCNIIGLERQLFTRHQTKRLRSTLNDICIQSAADVSHVSRIVWLP